MKEVQHSAAESSSSSTVEKVAGTVVTKFWNPRLPAHFNAGLLSVAIVSTMIVMQISDTAPIKRLIRASDPPEAVEVPQHWNYSSHEFLPIISNWDEQRSRWIDGDNNLKVLKGARTRVLMVTGSSQDEGELYILSHLLLRAAKNKQDYTQMHDMDLYYNMINPDPEFSDWWVKLPVVRMLMLRHPEVEWIWWLDADAVITNVTFQPRFQKLGGYNLVLQGEDYLGDPRGLSTGVFMIRNCQWSLDLLGAWANLGTNNATEEAGDVSSQTEMDVNRTGELVSGGDDRLSLVDLLAQDNRNPPEHKKWAPKVKLVKEMEYVMNVNGNWTAVGPKLEELGPDKDRAVPFITHFEGCLPHPSEVPRLSRQDSENFHACVEQLDRAFDFAENQVYRELGLERNTLGNSSEPFTWKEESTEAAFRILPIVTGWDEKRKAYTQNKPWITKDLAVLLSGSPPTPCTEKEGSHLLLRGLKNKIDYSRVHRIRIFYSMANIHTTLTGLWSKLPALKLMMIDSPDVEWIWWTDSDTVLTSMDAELPFERYNTNGYNLVLWGDEHEVFDLKKYNGINTGSMLIRNCQWSLDLLDRWGSLSNLTEDFLSTVLDRPESWPTDDQSTLVYLLITEREQWIPKVLFEHDIVLSGDWKYWTSLYVDEYQMRQDIRPLTTHFTDCHPCMGKVGFELCLERYDRTYNFADNQVLENYGLRHERLNSSSITSNFQADAQVYTDLEMERMLTKFPGDLSASMQANAAKEEVEVIINKEEDKVETTKEQEEMSKSKEEEQITTVNMEEQMVTEKKEEKKEVQAEEQELGKVDRPVEESELGKVPEENLEATQEHVIDGTKEEVQVEQVEAPLSQPQEQQNKPEEAILSNTRVNEKSATAIVRKPEDP
ncbi:unnamed protein product [Calypogeia fissa]